jgi:hypothetical protein
MSDLHTPNSRAYTHHACGNTTVVTDEHFTAICDPFRLVTGTFCVGCESHFPLKDFAWADTGEVIADARERWAREAPPAVRTLNSSLGCWLTLALGAAAGAAVGWFAVAQTGKVAGIGAAIGAVALPIVWLGFVVPTITKSVYNWDPRHLK